MIFIGRISLNNYTNFDSYQMTLKPELGITFLGIINLTYGYNFNLSSKDYYGITGHYVGLDTHFQMKDL